ncbi:MAG: host attachment protein [Deltaproteobacteria bacterium]|nr:MAG: host attachment protein [Deltaproteobacteria bacterium]
MKHWVLVATRERVRVFSAPGLQKPLQEEEEFFNAEARLQEQDMTTDRAGKNRDDGPGAHGYGVRDTAVKRSTMDFAREIADRIDKARIRGDFEQLSVVANPEFLGMLRKCWSTATGKCIIEEVAKDLDGADEATIRGNLTRLNA